MTMEGISQRIISVDFLTTGYRVVGKVLVGNAGLLGVMSDPSKSFIEIRAAQLANIRQPNRIVQRYDTLELLKESIFTACMERRDFVGPQSIGHRGYSSYQSYALFMAVNGFEIDATVEWTGRFDLSVLLGGNMNKFVPVYNATVTSPVIEEFRIESPAAMVNFHHLDLIAPAVVKET